MIISQNNTTYLTDICKLSIRSEQLVFLLLAFRYGYKRNIKLGHENPAEKY